jgi:hypothetical protein
LIELSWLGDRSTVGTDWAEFVAEPFPVGAFALAERLHPDRNAAVAITITAKVTTAATLVFVCPESLIVVLFYGSMARNLRVAQPASRDPISGTLLIAIVL